MYLLNYIGNHQPTVGHWQLYHMARTHDVRGDISIVSVSILFKSDRSNAIDLMLTRVLFLPCHLYVSHYHNQLIGNPHQPRIRKVSGAQDICLCENLRFQVIIRMQTHVTYHECYIRFSIMSERPSSICHPNRPLPFEKKTMSQLRYIFNLLHIK